MKKNPLLSFGNIPVQVDALSTCYPDLSAPSEKIRALERDGQLIRLKRGLYVIPPDLSGRLINIGLCANHIHGPSYVSFHWALRWYGLIPEQVFQVTSATTGRHRIIRNDLGRFEYIQVPDGYYALGLRSEESEGVSFQIASPEKALCDFILRDRFVPGRSVKRLAEYLEEDIRFDMDELSSFDTSIISACASYGRKAETLNNLLKIIGS